MTTQQAAAPLSSIVIVGGGTAGWMTAAAISRMVAAGISVQLIESDQIGTVGVGEATIPSLRDFNLALGINENEFLRAVQGTFKLGIEFSNWGNVGERYIHPFGKYGRKTHGIDFHQIWLKQKHRGGQADPGPIDDYSISIAAARNGRFSRPVANPDAILSALNYAYHIDAGRYAQYLRDYAEDRGVKRIEGKIISVEQAPDSGNITAVKLEDGSLVDGDFFVDCSGFRSLLLGETLGVPYISWQHWLPCDRAFAVPSAPSGRPRPYTRAMAEDSGWRWNIPLQHRTGNGHVFSSAHGDEDTALRKLADGMEGQAIGEPRLLRFVAGRREKLWEKNCLAIGLSGGFIEPLESTSIHLIQSGIFRLMALFPDAGFDPVEIREYNRWLIEEYEHIRDFIILHYRATERSNTDFWKYCQTMEIPDSLAAKIELWRGKGRIFPAGNSLFTEESWIAVLLGQNIIPHSVDPVTAMLPPEATDRFMQQLQTIIDQAAQSLPSHADYILANCQAEK
ncbi:tryptophan 7-halogenase [Parvularcula flava]|uniref:Tryptophan 7-halogenase n=1 Tax=Aquisalinus luteolus TaxID=1566827 RepID=A0A8J3A765_9PROT|nr:tryptophan halogenase family protein [Aquisalinus luteolus]NHK29658.1 tryptophan 7-halogenase [Aquisalinus luteolus]GGI02190.1 tryptophan halogenase [Aquisalinus luteolus]